MTDPFAQILGQWPPHAQVHFNAVRRLVLHAAREADVGPLTESLKWRQPAWRPERPNQGSTLRLNWSPASPAALTLFVDCKTTICATMREIYPTTFRYEGTRALHLSADEPYPDQAIDHLARLTFTYHRKTKPVAKRT